MKSLNEIEITEVKSLIKLLDDDDDSIYRIALDRLVEKGEDVLPYLRLASATADTAHERKIEAAFSSITDEILKNLLREFRRKSAGDVDLERGSFLIALHGYPQESMGPYVDLLNSFAIDLDQRLTGITDHADIVDQINNFFIGEKKFVGNRDEYYHPDNHYLNRVLTLRRGVPLSLAVVYLLVTWRLNIPMQGIGLPGHFVVRYAVEPDAVFIDPFNGGRLLSRDECVRYVSDAGYEFREEFLMPVSNVQILERMLRNLIVSFEREEKPEKVELLRQCIDILNSNV
ncbi:MAG: transglutaminase-like domain-containing protein [Ignavibacteriales bacterium]|nr:transglutaminase-like domain-containing protein [Ignavibacteriales bacterium]